jgi:hypothetical protein
LPVVVQAGVHLAAAGASRQDDAPPERPQGTLGHAQAPFPVVRRALAGDRQAVAVVGELQVLALDPRHLEVNQQAFAVLPEGERRAPRRLGRRSGGRRAGLGLPFPLVLLALVGLLAGARRRLAGGKRREPQRADRANLVEGVDQAVETFGDELGGVFLHRDGHIGLLRRWHRRRGAGDRPIEPLHDDDRLVDARQLGHLARAGGRFGGALVGGHDALSSLCHGRDLKGEGSGGPLPSAPSR